MRGAVKKISLPDVRYHGKSTKVDDQNNVNAAEVRANIPLSVRRV